MMLEYFDRLLFNAIVEYNNTINRCMDDCVFATMVDATDIGDAQERYMIQIVNAAESAGEISMEDWRTIRHTVGMIGLGGEDPDFLDLHETLRYEVDA